MNGLSASYMAAMTVNTSESVSAINLDNNVFVSLSAVNAISSIYQPIIIHDLFNSVDNHNHSNCHLVEHHHNFSLDNCFCMLTVNIRSLPCHYLEMETFLHRLNYPDIVFITETWLNSLNTNLYGFNSYQHVCKTRTEKIGGGVSIFIRDTYSFNVMDDLENILDDTAECKFIMLKNNISAHKKPIIMGVIYRPPNLPIHPFLEHLDQLLSTIENMGFIFHLCGDFNIDIMSYPNGPRSREFINILMSHSTFPLVTRPTRITRSSHTLIDNHLTNDTNLLHKSETYIINSSLSDHYPIFTVIRNLSSQQHSRTTSRYSPFPLRNIILNDTTKETLLH